MGYVYAVLWFIMAGLLFFKFKNESRVVYILSGYFVFAGCWWLANQFVEVDLMSGNYGWVLRGISLAMLVMLFVTYILERRNSGELTEDSSVEAELSEDESETETVNA